MRTTTTITLFLLMVLSIGQASAQPVTTPRPGPTPYYYFSQFQAAEGLPSNTVFCTAEDHDGFLWIGTRDGVCRFDGSTFTRMSEPEERWQMGGVVEALFVDDEGILWFSTPFGRGYYNPRTGVHSTIGVDTPDAVIRIIQDGGGDIWFCSSDLYKYNKTTGVLTKYPSNGSEFISIAVGERGRFWCTCSDGRVLSYDSLVDKFREEPYTGLEYLISISENRLLASSSDSEVKIIDPHTGQSSTIFNCARDAAGSKITCLLERVPGEFWIGTRNGIYVYSEGVGITCHICHSDSERMSISSSYVSCLTADHNGNVWAGTYYAGLNFWRDTQDSYVLFYPIDSPQSMEGKIVRAITSHDNSIWIGTEDGALNSLNSGGVGFQHHKLPGDHNNYQDILSDGDELWISTYGNGVFRYNPRTSTVIRHYRFADNRFLRELRTSSGDILVASTNGVYRYLPETDAFDSVPDSGTATVIALCEDSTGRIWVGTSGQGIILLDQSLREVGRVGHRVRITSFFEDSSHRMWATTEGGGVYIIDMETLEVVRLNRTNGLPSNITCSVTEDDEGMIWLSTINGLYLINPADLQITTSFFQETHLGSNLYIYGAVCKTESGSVFMGTTDGMLSFSPARIKSLHQDRTIFITSITGVNGSKFTELSSPGCSAAYSDKIYASYKDVSSLSIHFSCPNYSNMLSSGFRYTLSSRRGEISAVTSQPFAVLSNIGYGRHVFTVSLAGSDAPESTKSVEIFVRPPFIRSILADVIFALIAISVIFCLVLSIVRRRQALRRRQEEELEQAKQKELYESKNAFFMNIMHEIRTPLSLIRMPLERMRATGTCSEKELQAIQANTDRLLNLSNQLLDIRKLEQNEEKLEFTRQNICDIVRQTAELFRTVVDDQGIKLKVNVPNKVIDIMCARDSVEKIISNLINNAVKYGGGEITLSLTASEGKAVIRVDSNGALIPPLDRERIFEKFFHMGKGTGLGLPLARTLAELHDGRLFLDTSRTDVNSFVLELPLEHPESISLETAEPVRASDPEKEYDESLRDVLIVEDNQDFRLYVAEALSGEFNVFTAANGRAAVEKLSERKIDIIVSDIMMPMMDGCELCNYVKSTVEYSHIPVILLTAAVGTDTRIQTLKVGADGYFEKPFPMELLKATITNLFKNREISYRQFSDSPLSHFSSVPTNKMDEELMERLHTVLLSKMADSTLGIDDLSSALNISNSTLFRKVKANTGMNINEYIRVCRLKRAAELLASHKYRINEVADMVGFSSSSYFSTNFQKQFNISPSAFVKNLTAKK